MIVANYGRNKNEIHEVIHLRDAYGGSTTLDELVSKFYKFKFKGNKVYKCPKCHGSGSFTKRVNRAQYWECCDDYEDVTYPCDLCNGEGYTEHEYKPKMIQDGWE